MLKNTAEGDPAVFFVEKIRDLSTKMHSKKYPKRKCRCQKRKDIFHRKTVKKEQIKLKFFHGKISGGGYNKSRKGVGEHPL